MTDKGWVYDSHQLYSTLFENSVYFHLTKHSLQNSSLPTAIYHAWYDTGYPHFIPPFNGKGKTQSPRMLRETS